MQKISSLFLSFSPSLSKVVFISRSVLETVYSEQIIISDERKAVTRNCSDWRVAVNSRFSSNRTNKRFLLRVSCGRRKTRLCTVEDGEFPQHERGCTKAPVNVWLFRLYGANKKITRLIARLPARPWRPGGSPFFDDRLLYFVVIFFKNPDDGNRSKTGANHRHFFSSLSLRRSVNAKKRFDSVHH